MGNNDLAQNYLVCDVPISAETPQAAIGKIVDYANRGRGLQVHLCNSYTLSLVRSVPGMLSALQSADLNLPDGVPVALLGRRLGVRTSLRGPSLVRDVIRQGCAFNLRHYFYGGGAGIVEKMVLCLQKEYPELSVARIETPPFVAVEEIDIGALACRVQDSGANIVWVGLGTPKQDLLTAKLAHAAGVVVVPVGAAFDFISGRVAEAPRILHGSGFEWLFRLAAEPRRLWRRYLIGFPRFVVLHLLSIINR